MYKRFTQFVLVFIASYSLAFAQMTPQEALLEMGKGINLGNELEGEWGNPVVKEVFFDAYKEAGFQTVRLPITWDEHTSNSSPYTINASWLDHIEKVVDWALSKDLIVIINAHHEDWIKENHTAANIARFDSIWAQVADRFKDKSERLFFEMLNEPIVKTETGGTVGLTRSQVDALNVRIMSIIRKENPTRIIVYSGNGWTGYADMMAAAIPNDPYIMAYFHTYDPWDFAGEGLGTYGTSADISDLNSKFASIKNWAESNNLVVLLGEFAARVECDYNSRARFYAAYVEACMKNNFAFTLWDDHGWFRMYGRATNDWSDFKDVVMNANPETPTSLTVLPVRTVNTRLTWSNRVSNNDSIIVERRIGDAGNFVSIDTLSAKETSYIDRDLASGNDYYYRVATYYKNGTKLYSYPSKITLIYDQTDFNGPHNVPGTIEAEDFDLGGEGFAYHDLTYENIPGDYRVTERVDIAMLNTDKYVVTNIATGEWTEYTINVTESGTYELTTFAESVDGGGSFKFEFATGSTGVLSVPTTGDPEVTSGVSTTVELESGEQAMKVLFRAPSFYLDKFEFAKITSVSDINSSELSLYPVPAGNRLFLKLNERMIDVQIDIFSVAGNRVMQLSNYNDDFGIDIQELPAGIYLLNIQSSNQNYHRKFVKE